MEVGILLKESDILGYNIIFVQISNEQTSWLSAIIVLVIYFNPKLHSVANSLGETYEQKLSPINPTNPIKSNQYIGWCFRQQLSVWKYV